MWKFCQGWVFTVTVYAGKKFVWADFSLWKGVISGFISFRLGSVFSLKSYSEVSGGGFALSFWVSFLFESPLYIGVAIGAFSSVCKEHPYDTLKGGFFFFVDKSLVWVWSYLWLFSRSMLRSYESWFNGDGFSYRLPFVGGGGDEGSCGVTQRHHPPPSPPL